MRPVEDWADLMYDPDQAYHHLVPFGQPYSLCGALPLLIGDWYGTGSWAEYETAKSMPRCQECAARIPSRYDDRLPV